MDNFSVSPAVGRNLANEGILDARGIVLNEGSKGRADTQNRPAEPQDPRESPEDSEA